MSIGTGDDSSPKTLTKRLSIPPGIFLNDYLNVESFYRKPQRSRSIMKNHKNIIQTVQSSVMRGNTADFEEKLSFLLKESVSTKSHTGVQQRAFEHSQQKKRGLEGSLVSKNRRIIQNPPL
jgi:hypothetical protein